MQSLPTHDIAMINRLIKFPIRNMLRLYSILLGLTALAPQVALAQDLQHIATFKTWPGISQLITYKDRLWFVSSQPFEDTNAADIYSYSANENQPRYERSLFSQDAGNPVVYNGLLYWPFEDPRRSAGTGEYAITDGEHWQWQSMQSGSVMHVHAMNVCNDKLVAVTGSWTGQLHELQDNEQWQVKYDYPAGDASFSRLVNVKQLHDRCIVAGSARGKADAKLFEISNAEPEPLSGWPASDRADGLTVHNNALLAFVDSQRDRTLIRHIGNQTKTIELPEEHRPTQLHSDGKNLWLTTQHPNQDGLRGRLWKYNSEEQFDVVIDLPEAPISLTSFNHHIAIGTYAPSGGSLWLYKAEETDTSAIAKNARTNSSLKQHANADLNDNLVKSIYDELKALITDSNSTQNFARKLRQQLARHPDHRKPEFGEALTQLLDLPLDDTEISMFNRRSVTYQNLVRWYLLTTMAVNGHGRIDPSWINPTKSFDPTLNNKLFEPEIAAIVAIGWIEQKDEATIAALIKRLNNSTDPMWVKSDVIGALSALTNQRFAYDTNAWNRWWRSQ